MTAVGSSTKSVQASTSAEAARSSARVQSTSSPLPIPVGLPESSQRECAFSATNMPSTSQVYHTDPSQFIHLSGEAMEYVSKCFPSSNIPGKLEKLSEPVIINGQKCTHRKGPIFGSKSSVEKAAKGMENICKERGFSKVYKFILPNLEKGRVAIVALDSSKELKNAQALGNWGRFVDPTSRYKVGIMIDVANIRKHPGRSIEGVSVHEWMHELTSLNAENRGGIPFKANPCVTPEEAQSLTKTWHEAYTQYHKNSPQGKAAKAGKFFFDETGKYYSKYVNAHNEVTSLIQRMESTHDPVLKSHLKTRLSKAIREVETHGETFLTEIGTNFMEAKMDHGVKAIKKVAKKVGHELDRLHGEKIFLESVPRIATSRFWKATLHRVGKVLTPIALAVDLTEEVLGPREKGSFTEHVSRAAYVGSAKFTIRALSLPIQLGAFIESFQPEQEKKTPQQERNRFDEHASFMKSGGGGRAALPYAVLFPPVEKPFSKAAAFFDDVATKMAETLFKITPLSYGTDLVDKHLIAPHVIEDPEAFISITHDVLAEVPNFELPEDFTSWSDEKRASWSQEQIARTEKIWEAKIAKYEEQAKTEKVGKDHLRVSQEYHSSDHAGQSVSSQRPGSLEENADAVSRSICSFETRVAGLTPHSGSSENIPIEEVLAAVMQSDPEELQKIEQVFISGRQAQENLEKEWQSKTKTEEQIKDVLECLEDITSEIYRFEQKSLARTQDEIRVRQSDRVFQRLWDQSDERHHQPHVSLSMIQRGVRLAVFPQGSVSQRFEAARQFSKDYREAQSELNELIETRKTRQTSLDHENDRLNQLDRRIKKHYQKMIESRNKMIRAFDKAATALNIAGSILNIASPYGAVACRVGAMEASVIATELQKRNVKMQDRCQKKRETNLSIHERLANQSFINRQEMAGLEQEKAQQRRVLMSVAFEMRMPPDEYRKLLGEARTELQTDITKYESLVNNEAAKIEAIKKDLQNLEKTESKLKKKVNKAKDENTRKKENEKLFKTQQTIADRRTSLSKLEHEFEIDDKQLTNLRKDKEALEAQQRKDARLAPIREYFYEVIRDEAKKWESAEKEIQEWRDEIAKGLSEFYLAGEQERQAVNALFCGLNSVISQLSMLKGPQWVLGRYAQSAVHFSSEVYQLQDLYKNWSKAQESLSKTLESLQVENPNAGYLDAIQKMGAPLFIGSYLVPALQMIGIGVSLVRLGKHIYDGCPLPMSNEEMRIIQLGEFVGELSKHLDSRLDEIEKNLTVQFYSRISTVRAEMTLLAKEVISEVTASRKEILDRLRSDNYNRYTKEFIVQGDKVKKKRGKLRLQLGSSDLPLKLRVKLLNEFLIGLLNDIQCDLNKAANAGMIRGRNSTGREIEGTPLVDLSCIQRNPDIYTGVLASHLNIKDVPSLFLFNQFGESYCMLRSLFSEPPSELGPLMRGCREELKIHGEDLRTLMNASHSTIERVRRDQDQTIERLKNQVQNMQAYRQRYEHAIFQRLLEGDHQLTQEDSLSAHHRFHFAAMLSKTTVAETCPFAYPTYISSDDFKRVSKVAAIWTVMAIPTTLVVPPVGLVMTSIVSGILYSDDYEHFKFANNHNLKVIQCLFYQKRLKHFITKGLKAEDLCSADGFKIEILKISTWMNENGGLSSHIYSNYERSQFGESKFENSPFRAKICFKLEEEEEGEDRQQVSTVSHSKKSPITIDEVRQISKKAHVVDPDSYKNAVVGLLSDYDEWLTSRAQKQPCPSENRFSKIDQEIEFVIPISKSKNGEQSELADSDLVPLAFPKALISALEKSVEKERLQLEAGGIGTLVPSYRFNYVPQKGCYRLKFAFLFVPTKRLKGELKLKERVLLPSVTLAEVDEVTVRSFARPVFDKEKEANQPNLNEFLIQASYTFLGDSCLGMPGDRTVSMDGGKWIAPAESAFPGFFKIWSVYPTARIDYNYKKITPEMSNALMNLKKDSLEKVDGLSDVLVFRAPPKPSARYISVWTKFREGQKAFEENRRKLEENYQLIWSLCCLRSGADDQHLRAKLTQELGILDPKVFQSFHDVLSFEKAKPLNPEGMDRFNNFLLRYPSDYVFKFDTLMGQLFSEDTKGKQKI